MIDLEKQFKEERQPFIEYEPLEETVHKDPFIPAKIAEPTPEEQILVKFIL